MLPPDAVFIDVKTRNSSRLNAVYTKLMCSDAAMAMSTGFVRRGKRHHDEQALRRRRSKMFARTRSHHAMGLTCAAACVRLEWEMMNGPDRHQ
jgi:hypothetical protein